MHVSIGELATILGLTERRIHQLENAGAFRRVSHGVWDLGEAIQGYIRYMQAVKPRKRSAERDAHEKLVAAKADREELKLANERSRLIRADEAIECLGVGVDAIRAGFVGMPEKVTDDPAVQAKLSAAIGGIIDAAAAHFDKFAASVRARQQAANDALSKKPTPEAEHADER